MPALALGILVVLVLLLVATVLYVVMTVDALRHGD